MDSAYPFTINTILRGFNLNFKTSYGLFSYKAIDAGTRLLIDEVELNDSGIYLDLGCGYGAIGIVMSKLSPKGETYLVDRDFVAVDCSKINLGLNKVHNARALLSNGFSNLGGTKFDVIASHLPTHTSNDMLRYIISDAKIHLKDGGRIYVVTVSVLRHFIKREFTATFGNYEKVRQGQLHTVSLAIK